MPAHDWTRVTAGTFHHFHLAWIAELCRALNRGLLPRGYYALAEQVAGEIIPDVLTLQQAESPGGTDVFREETGSTGGGAAVLAVTNAPPHVSVSATNREAAALALRQRRSPSVMRPATESSLLLKSFPQATKTPWQCWRLFWTKPSRPCSRVITC